jgi:hypothetical protein
VIGDICARTDEMMDMCVSPAAGPSPEAGAESWHASY